MAESVMPDDMVWQQEALTNHYLDGVRGAIPLAGEQIAIMLRLIAATRPQVKSILDLGCGDGVLAEAILERFPAGSPTAVLADFSPPMLDKARQRFADNDSVRFLELDYGQSGWPAMVNAAANAPFDVIVSGFSIHHQPDESKQRIYSEIYDLLQPGGIFLNLEHVASASDWGEQLFAEHFVDSLYTYHLSTGGTSSRQEVATRFYYRADKEANLLAPVEAQCGWLRDLGFENVDCYFKLFELALFGGTKPAN